MFKSGSTSDKCVAPQVCTEFDSTFSCCADDKIEAEIEKFTVPWVVSAVRVSHEIDTTPSPVVLLFTKRLELHSSKGLVVGFCTYLFLGRKPCFTCNNEYTRIDALRVFITVD
jgi:hypothetical protein